MDETRKKPKLKLHFFVGQAPLVKESGTNFSLSSICDIRESVCGMSLATFNVSASKGFNINAVLTNID